MNKELKLLVKQAGFSLWGSESWKPRGAVIDWSCDYDDDLKTLIRLVIEKTQGMTEEEAINFLGVDDGEV